MSTRLQNGGNGFRQPRIASGHRDKRGGDTAPRVAISFSEEMLAAVQTHAMRLNTSFGAAVRHLVGMALSGRRK